MTQPQFQTYLAPLGDPNFVDTVFPISIMNDINLLYSYTQEEFIIRGVPVIENMIYNVCYTPIGTREFEPTFGSNMLVIIHELLITSNMDLIELELFSCLKRWVPYIALIFKQTYAIGFPDQNMVEVYIDYIDLFHNLPHNFVLQLIPNQIG